MLNLDLGQFVTVSNISNEPWFIKRWQAHTKSKKLKGNNFSPWIYDRDGKISSFFQVPTANALKYFIYYVNAKEETKLIYSGTLESENISKEEIFNHLSTVVQIVNKKVYN